MSLEIIRTYPEVGTAEKPLTLTEGLISVPTEPAPGTPPEESYDNIVIRATGGEIYGGVIYYVNRSELDLEVHEPIPEKVLDIYNAKDHVIPGETRKHSVLKGGKIVCNLMISAPRYPSYVKRGYSPKAKRKNK